ncbi:UNVERIFIED_CONTAM: hypothetical protein GTU68_050608 [Idotea baltica]|nr:hypothetical protein [Idotea baltica]
MYSHEETALGTGGAIKQAFDKFELKEAFVFNGDTFFPVSLSRQYYFHHKCKSDVTLAVKYLKQFNRYGTLIWNAFNQIEGFYEKVETKEGWINGGIYLVDKSLFSQDFPSTFSFENSVLETHFNSNNFFALPSPAYFIDFGVPEDYAQFQSDLLRIEAPQRAAVRTLFIDRDGVINKRIVGDYVREPNQFSLLPGVIDAVKKLRDVFDIIIVVTNQQGVGKGLMSDKDVNAIHDKMLELFAGHHVAIDDVLYCPELAVPQAACRKPNIGMALHAKSKFDSIDWSSCTMIGDSTSDIEFGIRLGMHTVLVGDKSATQLAHEAYKDLASYANQF